MKRIIVAISYKFTTVSVLMDMDAKAKLIAGKHGAAFHGSGVGFGQRDLDFQIEADKAESFIKALQVAGFTVEKEV